MSNFSTLQKQKYCDELELFIENTEKCLRETCSYLNWDFNKINENDEFITCPFNKAHRMPRNTVEKHLKTCEWNTLGYTKDCVPLSEPNLLPNNPSIIKFDMQLQHMILQKSKEKYPEWNIGVDEKLIPQTSDRLFSDFTNDERKAMYEYVISNTIAPDIGQDITDINKAEKTNKQNTPIIELLAQERNLKRRRTKHRGVHTNKKSQIEILRELVQQQMEIFQEQISEKIGILPCEIIEESGYYSKNNKNEIEKAKVKKTKIEEKKTKILNVENSGNYISKHDEKNLLNSSQLYYSNHKSNSKDFNEKLKKKKKYNSDCYRSSKDHYSQNLIKHDYCNKDHDNHESFKKDNRQYDNQHKIYNKNYDYTNLRYHKHDRIKSSEKKYEKSGYDSQKESNHKKNKKSYKKNREYHKDR